MKMKIFFLSIVFSLQCFSQPAASGVFVRDTMSIPSTGTVLEGEYVETRLKNQSVIRFFKTDQQKLYIRLILTKNFYFGKADMLEIRSGSKSYYAKDTRQHKVNKSSGLFLIEVQSNYIRTIKDEGITSIVFAGAETDFTNKDAAQVKKMAGLFYDAILQKNNTQ